MSFIESKEARHHPITQFSVAGLLLRHLDQWSNNNSTDTTFLGCFDEKTIIKLHNKPLGFLGNLLKHLSPNYSRDAEADSLTARSVLQSLVWCDALNLSHEVDPQGNYDRRYYVGIDGWDNLKKISCGAEVLKQAQRDI